MTAAQSSSSNQQQVSDELFLRCSQGCRATETVECFFDELFWRLLLRRSPVSGCASPLNSSILATVSFGERVLP